MCLIGRSYKYVDSPLSLIISETEVKNELVWFFENNYQIQKPRKYGMKTPNALA